MQNCAYLANMAVDGNYRRRGYGNILLQAADAVTKIAGEKTIYLHLRYVAVDWPKMRQRVTSCVLVACYSALKVFTMWGTQVSSLL